MLRHWVGKVTGGVSIITAVVPLAFPHFVSGDKAVLHSRIIFFFISALAFFLASLSAWQEKRDAFEKAKASLEDATDTNRPEVTAEFTMGPTNATYLHGGPQVKIVNRGHSDAWHTRIEAVQIGKHRVCFSCPPILEKDKSFEARCHIDRMDVNVADALEILLRSQALDQCREDIYEKKIEVSEERLKVQFDLQTSWADSRGNRFKSTGRVTYQYKTRMARTDFPWGISREARA